MIPNGYTCGTPMVSSTGPMPIGGSGIAMALRPVDIEEDLCSCSLLRKL